MTQSLPKSNEHTIYILDKYYPTIEDILRNAIYPRLLLLPNMPQKVGLSIILGDKSDVKTNICADSFPATRAFKKVKAHKITG